MGEQSAFRGVREYNVVVSSEYKFQNVKNRMIDSD